MVENLRAKQYSSKKAAKGKILIRKINDRKKTFPKKINDRR
jgi:hypothetical protein